MKNLSMAGRGQFVFILLASTIALGACSSQGPKPDDALVKAKAAVDQAQNADTRQYAAVDLNNAVTKLQAANDASVKQQYKQAGYLAEESQVDAELALAKTQAAKAKESDKQVQKGNQALSNQVNQPSNPPQR